MRLLVTTDFYGSFWPTTTSWGNLPGAEGLLAAINRHREQDPECLWIDTGDFAQGGPLAPLTNGRAGFECVATLGIDAAALGNHELDWGSRHLEDAAAQLPFPLLAANLDIGLDPHTILHTVDRTVGIIGITHPDLAAMHSWFGEPQREITDVVTEHARALRKQGVDWVVVALHDGVDYSFTRGGVAPRPRRIEHILARFPHDVDAVLGGHTLARHVGTVGGIPYVQPWAFGVELGVLELKEGELTPRAERVDAGGPWTGIGADKADPCFEQAVGVLQEPLLSSPRFDTSLGRFLAQAWRRGAGTEAAFCFGQELQSCQPPIDGTMAFLPSGTIVLADVLRLLPWTDTHEYGQLVRAEMTRRELELLANPALAGSWDVALAPEVWGPPTIDIERGAAGGVSVAFARQWAPRLEPILGRTIETEPSGTTLRQALLEHLEAKGNE